MSHELWYFSDWLVGKDTIPSPMWEPGTNPFRWFFFFFPGALLFPHMHALIRPLRIPESSLSETLFSLEYVLQTLATLVPPDSQFYLLKSGSCTEFHVCSSNLSQSETLLMQDTAQAIIGLT